VSRFEGKIGEADDEPVDAADILAALAKAGSGEGERREAIRRYLSVSDGWREASVRLCGAFAPKDWLKSVKGE
jgi:hypothetical protein